MISTVALISENRGLSIGARRIFAVYDTTFDDTVGVGLMDDTVQVSVVLAKASRVIFTGIHSLIFTISI